MFCHLLNKSVASNTMKGPYGMSPLRIVVMFCCEVTCSTTPLTFEGEAEKERDTNEICTFSVSLTRAANLRGSISESEARQNTLHCAINTLIYSWLILR